MSFSGNFVSVFPSLPNEESWGKIRQERKKMDTVKLPLGISSFDDIRKDGRLFIDKTPLIEEILAKGYGVFLFTRPRRFGKTLAMSMLSSFFDVSKDSRKLFDGLKISGNRELCDKWMNRYPTILVSFKSVDGLDFNAALDSLKDIIFNLFCSYSFLLESDRVLPALKRKFSIILDGTSTVSDIKGSLGLLVRMLSSHYGEKVILLIDEYDVPMAKASSRGYYDEMIDVMRSLLQALKDNDYLKFSVITGCLRIAKESIFTGLNNVYCNTVTSTAYDEYFGFTGKEVTDTFCSLGFENRLDDVKEWYDGYHFGNEDIYCPWDVIHYLDSLFDNPDAKPKNYWTNTSSNDIVKSFISGGRRSMFDNLDTLLSGGSITKVIDENITYDYLHSTDNNIWSVLLMTGYLTTTEEANGYPLSSDEVNLRVPNREIMSIFSTSLSKWVTEVSRKADLSGLSAALWTGDTETISIEMTKILNETISYHDIWHEDAYHLFFDGLFRGMGYRVESNREYGMGRPDIVVSDDMRTKVAVFELKGADETIRKASNQIEEKKYADGLTESSLIMCYAVRFSEKSAEVRLTERIQK